MSFIGDAIGSVLGGVTGAKQQAQAATAAAATQAGASEAGITEQRRQFDTMVQLMAPYVTAGAGTLPSLQKYADVGAPALAQQRALSGLDGPAAQRSALALIEQSPEMQAYTQQGENAMLQNAAATGGLRGGNLQGALAQFRPKLLAELVNQQYGRLGGLTALGQQTTQNVVGMGQASAAGQASSGMQSAANIANLLQNQGAALAGGQIAQGNVVGNTFGTLVGAVTGAKKAGFF
jgi:hypothetical protein